MGQALIFDVALINKKDGTKKGLISKCDLFYCTPLREFFRDDFSNITEFQSYKFNIDGSPNYTFTFTQKEYDLLLVLFHQHLKQYKKNIKKEEDEDEKVYKKDNLNEMRSCFDYLKIISEGIIKYAMYENKYEDYEWDYIITFSLAWD